MNLLNQEELKDLFIQQKNKFLDDNKEKFKQCPTPDCENILCSPEVASSPIILEDFSRYAVFCDSCGNDFCFLCLKSHYGENCELNRVKEEQVKSGIEQAKNCPSCRNSVAKSNSNDVRCGICKTTFCFLCSKDFGKQAERDEIAKHFLQMHQEGFGVEEAEVETSIFK